MVLNPFQKKSFLLRGRCRARGGKKLKAKLAGFKKKNLQRRLEHESYVSEKAREESRGESSGLGCVEHRRRTQSSPNLTIRMLITGDTSPPSFVRLMPDNMRSASSFSFLTSVGQSIGRLRRGLTGQLRYAPSLPPSLPQVHFHRNPIPLCGSPSLSISLARSS